MTLHEKCMVSRELNDLFNQVTQKAIDIIKKIDDDESIGKLGAYAECLELIYNKIHETEKKMDEFDPA